MPQVVIENPVLNSPFAEPTRHFRFNDEGITNETDDGRRPSSYFIPIAKPRKRGGQRALFGTEWTAERVEENRLVNQIRQRVDLWRRGGYLGVTPTTRYLLDYWTNPERERRLFFCQIEALETAIYIAEVAKRYGDGWIDNKLREANDSSNPGLPRVALKMATGTGKTVVMAMLIAWQTLNKLAAPQDNRFTDAFLLVTPGITIRDRLRVLLPNDPDNYYRKMDVLPADRLERLGQAKIVITNFHAFQLREKVKAGKLTKAILADGESGLFTETPDQMVRRVLRELGNKKNIIVINDEAHHCYRRKPDAESEKMDADERAEAKRNEEYARVWISGIEAVQRKIGTKVIYDLSATPFFLRGSGWGEGKLFPWVVSDFSLIDAIEAGIVKVPRVPVADDSMVGDSPTYRDLWLRIRDDLPKKGRKTEAIGGEPKLPKELQAALHSLYSNYEKYYRQWEATSLETGFFPENPVSNPTLETLETLETGFLPRNPVSNSSPPVFIVVCNNTNVSKLVYDYISGWEKPIGDGTYMQAGGLALFRNDDGRGGRLDRPNTILVDSEQLESGEAMSDEFKAFAASEIEGFKDEYRRRFPGRDAESLTDEDLLREVMNTVGKPGKLGEGVRCVVSVSMLTEGWDANTVTHVLGVRAFGTQLLCEQVVGRALRRMSYAADENGMFAPEYAEVYGVPFSFIPAAGTLPNPTPGKIPTRVRALEDRIACEITFPRVDGYLYDLPSERLTADFNDDSMMALTTADVPTYTENAPIVGESSIHTLDNLKRRREAEVAFSLARRVLKNYFEPAETGFFPENPVSTVSTKPWLFPQLLDISRRWMAQCLYCKDNTFPQMLLLDELAHRAADRIYLAIVRGEGGDARLRPILKPYDAIGSTRYVDFDTTRPVYATDKSKCHINYVVADTESWEQKMAEALEEMDEVVRYVKNHNLNFTIPYTFEGKSSNYIPDFIAHVALETGFLPRNPV
ncbi:MAG TPA: DEAD/DEAH box helicase family protein, partial [Promineifilum sp.]|nr:DEAD/DEAH box helicase family protein [Promineifilum sp.]